MIINAESLFTFRLKNCRTFDAEVSVVLVLSAVEDWAMQAPDIARNAIAKRMCFILIVFKFIKVSDEFELNYRMDQRLIDK